MCAQADQPGGGDPDETPPPNGGEPVAPTPVLTIEQVIASYHRAVYRYAFRLTGRVADAEDLTQQAFLDRATQA